MRSPSTHLEWFAVVSVVCTVFWAGGCNTVRAAEINSTNNTVKLSATPRSTTTARLKSTSDSDGVALGQAIFAGKGNCTACHTIGHLGDDGRGPDLAEIGVRARERAAQFGLKGLDAAVDYLVRSIVRPAADVVEGYNPAPESWLPSELTNDDLRKLVIYLQSLGGERMVAKVSLPEAWLAAKREEYAREVRLFSLGDAEKGKLLFHDPTGKATCAKCHKIDRVGENTCPDLTVVNRVQRPSYVLESILDSSAYLVRGYRQLVIIDDSGRVHAGLPKEEDEHTITLIVDQEGKTEVVQKEEIEEQLFSKVSLMPAGFHEQLTADQVMNLVAYLIRHDRPTTPPTIDQQHSGGTTVEIRDRSPSSLDIFGQVTKGQARYRKAMERGDPVFGGRIYGHYCTMCHGADGTGTGFNAVNLATKPANHTDDRRMSKTEDLLLHGVITRGGMKTGRSFLMPAWGGNLTERERWDVVAHLRTLHTDIPRRQGE